MVRCTVVGFAFCVVVTDLVLYTFLLLTTVETEGLLPFPLLPPWLAGIRTVYGSQVGSSWWRR